MALSERLFQAYLTRSVRLRYGLHLPPGDPPPNGWPLIMFLHGTGERGDDVARAARIGLPQAIQSRPDFPSAVLVPVCPEDTIWVYLLEALHALLDAVLRDQPADPARVYLTGLSLGATGVWYLAMAHPERFAALAPVSGRGTGRTLLHRLKHTPVWAFHGAGDTVVPPAESERMIEALRAIGGICRLTIYPDAGHDAWTAAYAEPELYRWLLGQRRTAGG
jgi:predicted peptidase